MEITNIRDLKPGMKNLNIVFIVLEIVGRPNTTKDGHEVRTCKIADRSACINLSVWDEPGNYLQSGDICKLTKGYASLWKGCLTLYTGKGGEIQKIGEFCMLFAEAPNMSDPNPEYVQQNMQGKPQGGGDQRGSPPTLQTIPVSQASVNQHGPQSLTPLRGNGEVPALYNQRGVVRPGGPQLSLRMVNPIGNHSNGMNNNKPRLNRR